jgi:hypothetical protein
MKIKIRETSEKINYTNATEYTFFSIKIIQVVKYVTLLTY